MNDRIAQEIQEKAAALQLAERKSTHEYEADWVADGRSLSKRGADGYCLKTGALGYRAADLLRILEQAGLYVPEADEELPF